MKIKPLDDRVVISRLEAEETTSGGILLPDSAKEKPQKGTILALGPGKLLDSGNRSSMEVTKGDTVLFGKYSGTDVTVDGQECVIMKESDILAIVK